VTATFTADSATMLRRWKVPLRCPSDSAIFVRGRPVLLLTAGVAGGDPRRLQPVLGYGGSWLLDTVGEGGGAVAANASWGAAALLTVVGAVKAAGAALPALVERTPGRRFRRLIRIISWIGGSFLIVYGSVFAVTSTAVLAGKIAVPDGIDRRGVLGHAMLWDPLFAVWGAALVVGLWLTRRSPRSVPSAGPAR
jgi:hypothetical protein